MYDTAVPSLQAVFDGARSFGLTDEEAWQTVDQCLAEVGSDATVSDLMEALSAALAQGVLAKQRGEPRPGPEGPSVRRQTGRRSDYGSA
jgi:hypothetical protein